jgi:hypothetical protein
MTVPTQEQTAVAAWLDEWRSLTSEAAGLAARLQRLANDAPPPRTAGDVRQLLEFREAARLDGPARDAAALGEAARTASAAFRDSAWRAEQAAERLLATAEESFPRLARDGTGLVSGADLPRESWFFFGPPNGRLIGCWPSKLPEGHVLRQLIQQIPPEHRYKSHGGGDAVVLGRARVREGDNGWVVSPQAWYALADVPGWTRAQEAERQREQAAQEAVSAALAAQERAYQEARDRADPARRLDRLEREVQALAQGAAEASP